MSEFRIPFPIPEPERSALILAGREAVQAMARDDKSADYRKAHAAVEAAIWDVTCKHGIVPIKEDR